MIDFHAHLPKGPGALPKLLASMDALGIERAVVVPGGSLTPEALSRGISGISERNIPIDNVSLIKRTAETRGRLIPFYFGNPHESPDAYLSADAARGLKLGPAVHGVPLRDPRNLAWVRAAGERKHPVYLHCLGQPGFDVPDLVELAAEFPATPFILGHAGVGNADYRAVALIAASANLSLETSGGFSTVIQFAVEKLGARRVLFGSEYPMQDPALEVLKAKRLSVDEDARFLVTRGNALRLLGEPSAGPVAGLAPLAFPPTPGRGGVYA